MRAVCHQVILPLLLLPLWAGAQTPIQIPAGAALQFQVQQPGVDLDSPVTATASFDPPTARVGQKIYYRVQLDATEASIDWPAKISAPAELKFGASANGQIMKTMGGSFRPVAAFVYEVEATGAGHFTVTNFNVNVNGRPVEVPAASLEVVPGNSPETAEGRRIFLGLSRTNLFLGEPFHLNAMLPSTTLNEMLVLGEVQINGDGFIPDKTTVRQTILRTNFEGQTRQMFIHGMTVTPIVTGHLKFSVQGFTLSPRAINGTISITGPAVIRGGPVEQVLLMSDVMAVNVRPLPTEGRLPGFTGSIGQFINNPPRLSRNQLPAGQPVHLALSIQPLGELSRLVPPLPPQSRDWQVIPDEPPAIGFTLIPLADDVQETPAIPYSYFDPETGKYVDLTVYPMPVTVTGTGLPSRLPATDEKEAGVPVKLSDLAATPGAGVASLKPLQLRSWVVAVQVLPLIALFVLVRWDRHRRFLEAHPEIVRRRRARRALRREKHVWRKAIATGDVPAFIQSAAKAMKIACAPHFPANPGALVCADVLSQLDVPDQTGCMGETVRKIFAVADARFAATPGSAVDVLSLEPKVDAVLMKLEEKL